METLKLNSNSWHYKLAVQGNWKSYLYFKNPQVNFCNYFWHVVAGSFFIFCRCMFALIVLTMYCGSVGTAIYWFISGFLYGFDKMSGVVVIGLALLGGTTALALVAGVASGYIPIYKLFRMIGNWNWNWNWKWKIKIPSCDKIPLCEDTKRFFVASYETFHNRFCYKLEFYDNRNEAITADDTQPN